MDRKEYDLNLENVDLVSFLNDIIDRFEMTKDQKITFVRRFPKKAIFVQIDKDKITQVIDNIIMNAIKYSPDGGQVTFKITVYLDYVQVRISDQGMGIAKKISSASLIASIAWIRHGRESRWYRFRIGDRQGNDSSSWRADMGHQLERKRNDHSFHTSLSTKPKG